MPSTVDRQLKGLPDTWYDFANFLNMLGFGIGMIAFGCLTIYGAFVTWFAR